MLRGHLYSGEVERDKTDVLMLDLNGIGGATDNNTADELANKVTGTVSMRPHLF